jgi:hypothetical protein
LDTLLSCSHGVCVPAHFLPSFPSFRFPYWPLPAAGSYGVRVFVRIASAFTSDPSTVSDDTREIDSAFCPCTLYPYIFAPSFIGSYGVGELPYTVPDFSSEHLLFISLHLVCLLQWSTRVLSSCSPFNLPCLQHFPLSITNSLIPSPMEYECHFHLLRHFLF